MIWSLCVGFVIGSIAGAFFDSNERPGCFITALVGLLGSVVGQLFFGNWGPHLADMAVIPSILGAILLIAVFGHYLYKH